MFVLFMKIAGAVALGFFLNSVAYCQSRWEITQIFSTADGSVQFVQLESIGETTELPVLAGQMLIADNGITQHAFTFPSNVAHFFSDYGNDTGPCGGFMSDGCWSYVLVATQGFADLNVVKPDFVVPNGFLFLSRSSVRLGISETRYDALPGPASPSISAVAFNNTGEDYQFIKFDSLPLGINPLIEYYHAGLDDYFLTAYAAEIQSLDSANPPVWQRTGYSLPAWTSTFSASAVAPPNSASACRLWLGDSHFYSISPIECYQASRLRGAVFESQTAFLATLPNVDTGNCLADQARLYRLWKPTGSNHRYTTETAVRDEMLARGWIAEGYGPDRTTMCVGGNR